MGYIVRPPHVRWSFCSFCVIVSQPILVMKRSTLHYFQFSSTFCCKFSYILIKICWKNRTISYKSGSIHFYDEANEIIYSMKLIWILMKEVYMSLVSFTIYNHTGKLWLRAKNIFQWHMLIKLSLEQSHLNLYITKKLERYKKKNS